MMMKVLFRISARNGAVAGVLAFVLLIVMYYMGRHPMVISPLFDFRILLLGVFIYFTLKEFRDYHQAGMLSFAQGMIGGFIVVGICSLVATTLLLFFGKWNEEFVSSYITQFTEYIKSFPKEDIEKIGKEVYERNLRELPTTNISGLAGTYFVQGLILGFFVNIIISVVLRRQTKPK
jgi:hypothetical protein